MKIFKPDKYVNSIFKIDLQRVKNLGITTLLIDIDNTIVPMLSSKIKKEVKEWFRFAKRSGFKICLISNSIRIWRAKDIANALDVPLLLFAAKPFPFTFYRALRIVKSKTSEAAVIGDQVFMDILGGNLSKIYTILVKPISKEKMWIRKIMRWLEKKALNLKL